MERFAFREYSESALRVVGDPFERFIEAAKTSLGKRKTRKSSKTVRILPTRKG